MQEIVLVIGLIAYLIFIIQFLLSLFGYNSDIDLDVDFDGNVDFSLSDLISFKGLVHFLMGSTTYLYTNILAGNPITVITWIIAALIGIMLTIGLYCMYKSCMKLQHVPKREEGILEDRYVTIMRHERELTYIGHTHINGAYDVFTVESSYPLEVGSKYKISKFINNKIYIN